MDFKALPKCVKGLTSQTTSQSSAGLARALPKTLILLVGAARFELTTPCAQGRCATRLRYAPTTFDCSSAHPSCYPYNRVLVEERGPPVTRCAIPWIRSAGRKGQPRRNR